MAKKTNKSTRKKVETLTHDEASRKNIPTAEYQSVMAKEDQDPIRVTYERRNRDLDPQLVWRGKDTQDLSDLVVQAPPLFIQEKVHPKVLIDDLMTRSRRKDDSVPPQLDLFETFNGLPDTDAKTEFYRHNAHWANRMILGDSLQVMASLAEREGLRGQVQCIYVDPPYGIKFNSNFQWSTTSRDVSDGKVEHITREPEQVRAFRDTWRDGVHSYLTYLRDRLTIAHDLLASTGSVFVQIGDENVHRIRALLDEVFGDGNFAALITIEKTSSQTQEFLSPVTDYLLWYAKDKRAMKFRHPWLPKGQGQAGFTEYSRIQLPTLERRTMDRREKLDPSLLPEGARVYRQDNITSQSLGREKGEGAASWFTVRLDGREFTPSLSNRWKTNEQGMHRLKLANRIEARGSSLAYVRFVDDFPAVAVNNIWRDVKFSSRSEDKAYVVQTAAKMIERCILMTTDPGDLVLDPTCGSGTTSYVAEQWGRRWITIDTSRVAMALARARIMGARYAYYTLADSPEGKARVAEVTRTQVSSSVSHGDIRQGFVYERIPHVTLKAIANNSEIDVIAEQYESKLTELLATLNKHSGGKWSDWEVPREVGHDWSPAAKKAHESWWSERKRRQDEIDRSIAAKADFEFLYDRPHEDRRKVRVAGPFTVESVSPHRVLGVDENDELIYRVADSEAGTKYGKPQDFASMILENLKTAGVQQAHREDKIAFSSLKPWPGTFVCAEGEYVEGNDDVGKSKRAAIFIGPEFGTVSRPDLVAAAREAGDADFDVLIACAFNYEAHASEFNKLGRIPVLKARMNADLHMSEELKNTGKGNLFVIFGEPDIEIVEAGERLVQVKVKGVDVFHPNTGEIRSDDTEGIACWFIDTDYNEESFFVRHAYFLGANDPYKALKSSLKAEINREAWESLHSDTSRPFKKPWSGRIAVKVINHLGDEVMKVFRVT